MSRHDRNPRGGQPRKNKHKSADKRQRQEANRDSSGRRQAALDEARREQDRLDRRIAREAVAPAEGRVAGAEYDMTALLVTAPDVSTEAVTPAPPAGSRIPRQRTKKRALPVPDDATGKDGWRMGQARSMLRAGYHVTHVMRVTGWGLNALDDMPVDQDGYGQQIA